jgi:hypothetical protein
METMQAKPAQLTAQTHSNFPNVLASVSGIAAVIGHAIFKNTTGPIRQYAGDVLVPFSMYTISRGLGLSRPMSAAVGLMPWIGWELLQKASIAPGTYDPKDFLAYGAGVIGAIALDIGANAVSKIAYNARCNLDQSIDKKIISLV